MSEDAREHYQKGVDGQDLVARVQAFLDQLGDGPISSERLAGIDQFHSGGLKTTADFFKLLEIQPQMNILDAGSGLGGPSRYVAEKHGCRVTGIDLTDSFVAVARLLAERMGVADAVRYEVGNLLALPLENGLFDVAYTQHVLMNIRDRSQVYGEIHRVLKPGGKFAFFDVLAVDGSPAPTYPLPWSESPENSVLLTEDETRAAMSAAGLEIDSWKDVTKEIIEWFDRFQLPAMQTGNQAPTLTLVMGDRFERMAENFVKNLRSDHVRLVMATSTKR